jgi:broad specificity phosphatase PhoE
MFGETPLKTVYATPYARTRLTAEPVARATGAPVVTLDDTRKTIAALAAAPWGSTTVVVGHSNTVPEIVAGLTHEPFPSNLPVTHDRIWLLTLSRDGAVSVVRLRYGAPDAPPAVR